MRADLQANGQNSLKFDRTLLSCVLLTEFKDDMNWSTGKETVHGTFLKPVHTHRSNQQTQMPLSASAVALRKTPDGTVDSSPMVSSQESHSDNPEASA